MHMQTCKKNVWYRDTSCAIEVKMMQIQILVLVLQQKVKPNKSWATKPLFLFSSEPSTAAAAESTADQATIESTATTTDNSKWTEAAECREWARQPSYGQLSGGGGNQSNPTLYDSISGVFPLKPALIGRVFGNIAEVSGVQKRGDQGHHFHKIDT